MACLQMSSIPDQTLYNKLPSLQEVNDARKIKQVDNIISGPLREVFVKHNLQHTHCLYLQHRHHAVKEGEAVVKVNGTAHVMDQSAVKDIASFGNKVVPTTWMTCGGKVVPMELAVVSEKEAAPALSSEFTSEFVSVLAENDCEGLFGVDTLAPTDWAETSIGNSSVVVPDDGQGNFNKDEFIDVAFAFNDQDPDFRAHGKCKSNHKHTSAARHDPGFHVHGKCKSNHKHTSAARHDPGFHVHGKCKSNHKHTSAARHDPGFHVHGKCKSNHKHTSAA